MTSRPDQLQVSLGAKKDMHKANLQALAKELNIPRGSIGGLLVHLSQMYSAASAETVAAYNIAAGCASGEEWDELIEIIHPEYGDE